VRVCITPTQLDALTERDLVAVLETRVLPARHEVTTAARRDMVRWEAVEEVHLPRARLLAGPLTTTFDEPLSLHSQSGLRRRSREVRVVYYELVPTVHSEAERVGLACSTARLERITQMDWGRLVAPIEPIPSTPGGTPGVLKKSALSRRPLGGRRHLPALTTAFTLQYVRTGVQPVLIDISVTVDRLVGWPFSAARPFFVLYVPAAGPGSAWKPIWRSEVMVAGGFGRSPSELQYSPVELPPSALTGQAGSTVDGDQPLLVEFFHYKTSGNPRLLSILQTSLDELRAMPASGGTLALNIPQFKNLSGGARLRFITPVPTGVRYALQFDFGGLKAGACCFLRVSLACGQLFADLSTTRTAGRSRKVSVFFVLHRRRSPPRRHRSAVGPAGEPPYGSGGGSGGGSGSGSGGGEGGSSASDAERESWKQLFQSETVTVDCSKRPAGTGEASHKRLSHLVGSLWRDRSDASLGAALAPAGGGGTAGSVGSVDSIGAGGSAPVATATLPYATAFRYYRIPPLGDSRSPVHAELLLSVYLYHPTGNHKQVASVRTTIGELLAASPDQTLPRFCTVPEAAAGASAVVSRSEQQEQRSFVDVRFSFPSA